MSDTTKDSDATKAAAVPTATAAVQPEEVAGPRSADLVPGSGTGSGPEIVDIRTGMFGIDGSGDTSGFGGLVRPVAMPGPSPRPYGGWFDEAVDILAEVLAEGGVRSADAIEKVVVDPPGAHAELTLHVHRDHLVAVARALRDDQDLRFELSLGVSGVHYPHDAGRELHAVYHLTSVTHGRRLRLEVSVPEGDARIPSTVSVYPANDWHERETWDFFGIVFEGHPALARIEMPDDWPGHPQRKDYPLGGIPVEYKGATVPPADTRRSYS